MQCVKFTGFSVQFDVSSVQYAACSIQYALCSMQYAVCNVQYEMCSMQDTYLSLELPGLGHELLHLILSFLGPDLGDGAVITLSSLKWEERLYKWFYQRPTDITTVTDS